MNALSWAKELSRLEIAWCAMWLFATRYCVKKKNFFLSIGEVLCKGEEFFYLVLGVCEDVLCKEEEFF